MKKLALIFCIMLCFGWYSKAQAPEEFNYQAILRDNTGELIVNQSVHVRISILNESSEVSTVYSEIHTLNTGANGEINLKIGTQTPETGVFADINWGADLKFMKVEVDAGSGYTDMGTFQLLSVPFALYAKSASKAEALGQSNVYSTQSDTLFVVKDHEGNVVFAIFPDGAQLIVNQESKGRVGGFAVSGRSPGKGSLNDYLVVTGDSTRIYVNDTLMLKGRVGGFAVSGRSPAKIGETEYLVVTPDSTRVYVNEESKTKGRVGGFAVSGRSPGKGLVNDYLQVTRDSTRVFISESAKGRVGGFVVSGRSPGKSGMTDDYFNISGNKSAEIIENEPRVMWYPQKAALLAGEIHVGSPDSVGTNSTAFGYRSIAMGEYSQAMGYRAQAIGNYSTAIGYEAVANDTNTFAFGQGAKALNEESYAFGRGAVAEGYRSFALGSAGIDSVENNAITHAIGDYSFAIGQGSVSSGYGSFSVGIADSAYGEHAVAVGFKSVSGAYSTAIGNMSNASYVSTAIGTNAIASGDYSSAIGINSESSGHAAVALGSSTIASGIASTAIGNETTASGEASSAMGFRSVASGMHSTAIGHSNISSGDYSTAIGYKSLATGERTIAMGFMYPNARGIYSIATGYGTVAKAAYSFVTGMYNDTLSSSSETGWQLNDPIFIVGNGTDYGLRQNAMIVFKNGNTWFNNDVSALSFTDRTPYPKDIETAYKAVLSMQRLPVGKYDENNKEKQLDHSTLHPFIKSPDGEHRDLSATVSAQNEVIKDLINRMDLLKTENQELKQKLDDILNLIHNK